MTIRPTARLLLLVSVCALALAACVHPRPPTSTTTTSRPTTTTRPAPSDLLLEWSSTGAFCPSEVCDRRITIAPDGAWHYVGGGRDVRGTLLPGTVDLLAAQIRGGLATLATLPRANACPSIRDLPDITYRFHVNGSVTEVSNCKYVIPSGNQLLIAVNRVLQQITAEATAANKPLVEWTASGGLCPWGVCGRTVRINQDGTWRATNGSASREGTLDPATTAELRTRISQGLDSLSTLRPSDGLCPSAYDGSDIVYRLFAEGRGREVSNCRLIIPGDNALLLHVQGIINPIIATVPNPPPTTVS